MSAITIEAAAAGQSEQILSVLVAAFGQYRDVLDPPSGVFRETPASIRGKIESGGGFVADDAGVIVGMVLYQPYPDYMYLGRLAVLPEYRGRRIAGQLVEAVEKMALAQHLPVVQLGVRIELTGNQRLFERLGFCITAYHSHEGYAQPTYVTMQKIITNQV